MIKQEITYYKNTYIEKSFKEFSDGKLISHIEYDKSGKIIYQENSDGHWCKWEYDKSGNKIYEEYSTGNWWKYKYDKSGNKIYEEDSYGHWYKWKDNKEIESGRK